MLLAIAAAYWPVFTAGFIWDDAAHLTRPALRSLEGLGRIWVEPGATQQYYPLLHSLFWLEHHLWGDNALGYHLANVALHAGASILFARLLRRLAAPGATLAALVFALHPVHVESVAWISEQKNTLSTLFCLAAALMYLRFDVRRTPVAYASALGLFGLALGAKTVTATLPAALLVILWWQRGRVSLRRDVLPLAPWCVLGAAAGLFTAWVERTWIGAEGAAFDLGFLPRCMLAGRASGFYFAKLIWPANLIFNYPRWTPSPASPVQWLPLLALLALIATFWHLRARSRTPLAIVLLFVGMLVPVLGFLDVYPFQYSYVADHFQYLASLPVIAAAGAVLSRIQKPMLMFALAGALGLLTWRQAHDYRDSETLFRATIARNPGSWMAHNNLGELLMKSAPTLPEALGHLERAVALRPDYPEALNNLGLALTRSRRAADALPILEKSVRLKPGLYQTHNNLGIALASLGRAEEAARAFERATALNPTLPNLHENWARALLLLGDREAATQHFAEAQRLRGHDAVTPSPPTSPPKAP